MKLPWHRSKKDDEEAELAEWQRIWQSMPHRIVPDVAAIDAKALTGSDLGNVTSATVSLVPEQYIERVYFSSNKCVICSTETDLEDSFAASLHAYFEKFPSGLGFGVRICRTCFESLPVSTDLPPIPA